MSMDPNRWLKTLPNVKMEDEKTSSSLDADKWMNTIPKKNTNNRFKIYSIVMTFFIVGLVLVPTIKNKTRNLQKEINSLQSSINNLKLDLHQSYLDHEVITSPENISRLAKEHLGTEYKNYNISQIKHITEKPLIQNQTKIIDKDENTLKKVTKQTGKKIKLKVAKKIEQKKVELRKLQELYHTPEKLPQEIKQQVAKKITKTKNDIKELYNNPKESVTVGRAQRWAAIQVVKAFLGIPIIPGE